MMLSQRWNTSQYYRLKDNIYVEPDRYLDVSITIACAGQRILFSMQYDEFIKSSIINLGKILEEGGDNSDNLYTCWKRAVNDLNAMREKRSTIH